MHTSPPPDDLARRSEPRSGTKPSRRLSRILLAALVGALGLGAFAGCSSIGYVAHVTRGQFFMWWDRELLDPERIAQLSDEERQGVETIDRARAYAATLGLRPSTSYRHVIDRDDQTAVRVVIGSLPNHLEAVSWWFPIVGRMTYRGYFDPERANRFAEGLRDEGYDTYVRRASFYSTLGYFDDPIPLGVLRWSEVELFDVILHELVHGTVFVASDSEYNESLASFIAEQGTLRSFAEQPEKLAEAKRMYADRERYTTLIDRLARALEELYAKELTPEQAREQRKAVFERFQTQVYDSMGFETENYAGFRQIELTNAFVVAQRTYSGQLPCLQAELDSMNGDLIAFVRAHREQPGRRTEPAELCGTPS